MAVQIFADSNFSGAAFGPTEESFPNLSGDWNDKISSIKICSGTWQFFSDANYQGSSFQLQPGDYPILAANTNDTISSFRKVG